MNFFHLVAKNYGLYPTALLDEGLICRAALLMYSYRATVESKKL